MDDPHAEVEIKPQLKPRGSVAKEEDPKSPHWLVDCVDLSAACIGSGKVLGLLP